MKIKICGMKFPENIASVASSEVDYMGFIFYRDSKRFVGENFNEASLECIPKNIQKIAVFVNESVTAIHKIAVKYDFDCIQLHGSESPTHCKALKVLGYTVIKAFPMDKNFNFKILKAYELVADYYLFDTPTCSFGGSGNTFSWQLLDQYDGATPFFLSGGLGLHNIYKVLKVCHPRLYGLDFNSCLEIKPGLKDIKEVQLIIHKIKKNE